MGETVARRGLSLLEVVVAVSLLSATLFTIGIIIPRCVLYMRNHGYQAQAVQLSDRLLEEIRLMDPSDVRTGTFTDSSPDDPPASSGRRFPPEPFPRASMESYVWGVPIRMDYQFTVTVEPHAIEPSVSPPGGQVRKVSVTAVWREKEDASLPPRTFTVSTYVP